MLRRVKGSASRGQNNTYLGVATDHVIESFRNRLWPDYKTGAGIEPALFSHFHPLEEALAAMGVVSSFSSARTMKREFHCSS